MIKFKIRVLVAALCVCFLAPLLASGDTNTPAPGETAAKPHNPDVTAVCVTYKSGGKEVTTYIPVDADTFLWKGSSTPQGHGRGLLLRENRFSVALIKLDLSQIPKDAEIEKASLQFNIFGEERKQEAGETAIFICSNILTAWTEDATWVQPQPGSASWDGLIPGKDVDTTPFASVTLPGLADREDGAKIIEIPGFEAMLKQWLSGAVPNYGFMLEFKGRVVQLALPAREYVPK